MPCPGSSNDAAVAATTVAQVTNDIAELVAVREQMKQQVEYMVRFRDKTLESARAFASRMPATLDVNWEGVGILNMGSCSRQHAAVRQEVHFESLLQTMRN